MDPLHYRRPTASQLADLPIFQAPAPSVGVDTSEAAADLVFENGTAQWVRVQALRLIASRDTGYTDAELQEAIGLPDSNNVRPRRWDIERQHLVRRDDSCTRVFKQHRPAHPYVITMKGVDVLHGRTAWPWTRKREDAA